VATTYYSADEPVSATEVISAHPGILHGILLNSVAATATINLYDDITTSSPANPINGTWTPGAVVVPTFIPLDIALNHGLVVVIATAAANVTCIGRFQG
jgi:hypothetical protein